MPFQFSESGSDSFVFTADQTHHVDLNKVLTLTAPSMVEVFTSAQFAGIQLWAVDLGNAQALNAGQPFDGVALSSNGQFGLVGVTLPAGSWYFGGLDTAAIPAGGSVGAFIDASVVTVPGATLAGNVPMAVYGNPGSWRAVGFDVSGTPQAFLETEAVGGKLVVMTDAQYQTFAATYAHGYNGGDLSFVAPTDLAHPAGFLAGDQGAIDLTAGRYDLVWINDTCDGGNGNDQCRGGQGDDSVSGGAGDDFISGDRGSDTVSGGAGADLFHTFSGAGLDKVLDFHLSEGDRVMLDPGTVYTVSQVGSDTVVDMGNGDQMILVGIQMSTLTPGWIFGN